MDTRTNKQRFHDLALKCVQRMEALNIKGKRADDAALHYYCGAGSALPPDDAFYPILHTWIAMILATRGMGAVRKHAAGSFDK